MIHDATNTVIHDATNTVPGSSERSRGPFALLLVYITLTVESDFHANRQVKRKKYNIFLWSVLYPSPNSGFMELRQCKLIILVDYMKTLMNIILCLHSVLPLPKGYF